MSLITRSTFLHLRFPFSYFLMPVFFFALAYVPTIHLSNAVKWFLLLHLIIYPSSNGYNSLQDKDEGSIGGLKYPPAVRKDLSIVTILMDVLALALATSINRTAFWGSFIYIACSRLYSYRGIRLKKYPLWGYLLVILNQGGLIFYLTWMICNKQPTPPPMHLLVAAILLIGAFYPITQIYQHRQDAKDGVRTWSMLLGIQGTFLWCAILYVLSFALLFFHHYHYNQLMHWLYLMACFTPAVLTFLWWWNRSRTAISEVNFQNTMRLNWVAATAANLAFITLLLIRHLG